MPRIIKHILISHYSSVSQEITYEAAWSEATTDKQVIFKLLKWAGKITHDCQIPGCQCKYDTASISSEMTPEMKASGKYENMIEIK
jgi:hypothetical protein